MPRPLLPFLALAFAILALGFSAIFVKWAQAPGVVSGFYRMGIAVAVLAAPVAAQVAQQAKKQAPLSRKHLWLAVLAGLFFAGDLGLWNTAVLVTNAANATLFSNIAPLWVGLGAIVFFREKLHPAFWGGVALALVGAGVIFSHDFLQHPTLGWADGLSVLSGVFYAGFFLATQRAREGLSALVTWWVAAAASTVALLVVSVALNQPLLGYSLNTWLSLLGVALITQVGGYLAMNYALGHLPASLVAPTMLGQPVMTALLAIPLLGEALTWEQVFGGALVLAGIGIVNRYTGKQGNT